MKHHPDRPSSGTTTLAAGAALVLALGAVGCGGGSDDDEPTTNTAAAASGDQGAGSSTAPVTDAAPASAAADDQPKAIASRPGDIDGEAVTAEVVGLKRSGPTVVLSLRLRPTRSGADTNAQIAGSLSDGVFEEDPDGKTLESNDLDGITLVDTANRKRHLVARDSRNGCVCSSALSSVFVRDAAPINLSATFGAPPADVRTMDVSIPKFGTFTDVPVS
jgi:hypothetical protein